MFSNAHPHRKRAGIDGWCRILMDNLEYLMGSHQNLKGDLEWWLRVSASVKINCKHHNPKRDSEWWLRVSDHLIDRTCQWHHINLHSNQVLGNHLPASPTCKQKSHMIYNHCSIIICDVRHIVEITGPQDHVEAVWDMSDAFAFQINKDKQSDQNIATSFPSSPLSLKIIGNWGWP